MTMLWKSFIHDARPILSGTHLKQNLKSLFKSDLKLNLSIAAVTVGLTAFKTWFHGKSFEKEGFHGRDLDVLKTQECMRQLIGTGLYMATSLGSIICLQKWRGAQTWQRSFQNNLIASLLGGIPDATLRPWLTAKMSRWILTRKQASLDLTQKIAPPTVNVYAQPSVCGVAPTPMNHPKLYAQGPAIVHLAYRAYAMQPLVSLPI